MELGMTGQPQPPYGLPGGWLFAMAAEDAGLVNINIYASPEWGPWRIDIDAIYMDRHAAKDGIPLAIFWRLPTPDFSYPLRYARVNNRTDLWTDREGIDADSLDLWNMGTDLIDYIPEALETLDRFYKDVLWMREKQMERATDYVIARLDKTAHLRSRPQPLQAKRSSS